MQHEVNLTGLKRHSVIHSIATEVLVAISNFSVKFVKNLHSLYNLL